jgi:hypothetical protein
MKSKISASSRFLAMACIGIALAGQVSAAPVGIWTDGDSGRTLSDVHLLGAASRLPDGRVIVAGGLALAAPFPAITTAEIYDPTTRSWAVTGGLRTPRWSLDAITLATGQVLFAGGARAFAGAAALASAEIYDPATGGFSYTANDLSVARQGFGISTLNDGRVLLAGGNASGSNLGGGGVRAVDIYDPVSDRFEAAASMNFGRSLHAQVTLRDGRVAVIGGAQSTAEIFDPAANRWTVAAGTLPTTLKDMKAFELFDGRVFVAGGQNTATGVTTDATWYFDPADGSFTPGPSMAGFNYAPSGAQVGTSDYSAFDLFPSSHPLHGRYILFAGGEHQPPSGPDVELHSSSIFDAANARFVDMGPMPFVHDDHAESLLWINAAGNPEVLLFGGNRSMGTSRFEFIAASVPEPSTWMLLAAGALMLAGRARARTVGSRAPHCAAA